MRSSKITRNIICSRRINIIAIIFIHRIEFLSRVVAPFFAPFFITSFDYFDRLPIIFHRAWEFVSREGEEEEEEEK